MSPGSVDHPHSMPAVTAACSKLRSPADGKTLWVVTEHAAQSPLRGSERAGRQAEIVGIVEVLDVVEPERVDHDASAAVAVGLQRPAGDEHNGLLLRVLAAKQQKPAVAERHEAAILARGC